MSSADRDNVVLRCVDLAKHYPGPVRGAPAVTALAHASLDVQAGQLTAVVGRSGSGKSTLLTLLGLLDEPSEGVVEVEGQRVSGASARLRARLRAARLGFVFQQFNLVAELSAVDNVTMALRYCGAPRRGWRERSVAALEQVGLAHRVGSRVSTLSGGEQQRVALARALVKEPAVVFADEPTGNLDSTTEDSVIRLLQGSAARGTAVVVVTHSLVLAEHADVVVTMHDGVLQPRAS